MRCRPQLSQKIVNRVVRSVIINVSLTIMSVRGVVQRLAKNVSYSSSNVRVQALVVRVKCPSNRCRTVPRANCRSIRKKKSKERFIS